MRVSKGEGGEVVVVVVFFLGGGGGVKAGHTTVTDNTQVMVPLAVVT